jgi:hypothetical protein
VTISAWFLIVLGGAGLMPLLGRGGLIHLIIAGLPGIVAGIWMLKGRNWARSLAIIYSFLPVIGSLILIGAASFNIHRIRWSEQYDYTLQEYVDEHEYDVYIDERAVIAVEIGTLSLTFWLFLLTYLFSESVRAFFNKQSPRFGSMPFGAKLIGFFYCTILSPGILPLIAGFGLVKGKHWARDMAIIVAIIMCLGTVFLSIIGTVTLVDMECVQCISYNFPGDTNDYQTAEFLVGASAVLK